jgi:aromatic ring-opening dioxygenase catalytic subunit (LigB family)
MAEAVQPTHLVLSSTRVLLHDTSEPVPASIFVNLSTGKIVHIFRTHQEDAQDIIARTPQEYAKVLQENFDELRDIDVVVSMEDVGDKCLIPGLVE